jgi:hypothetical protein
MSAVKFVYFDKNVQGMKEHAIEEKSYDPRAEI